MKVAGCGLRFVRLGFWEICHLSVLGFGKTCILSVLEKWKTCHLSVLENKIEGYKMLFWGNG